MPLVGSSRITTAGSVGVAVGCVQKCEAEQEEGQSRASRPRPGCALADWPKQEWHRRAPAGLHCCSGGQQTAPETSTAQQPTRGVAHKRQRHAQLAALPARQRRRRRLELLSQPHLGSGRCRQRAALRAARARDGRAARRAQSGRAGAAPRGAAPCRASLLPAPQPCPHVALPRQAAPLPTHPPTHPPWSAHRAGAAPPRQPPPPPARPPAL